MNEIEVNGQKPIRIGIYTYKVEPVPGQWIDAGDVLEGQIFYEDLKIKLNVNRPPQKLLQTKWHEIFHGICKEHGITMPNDVRESVIDALATGLVQVAKDNPHLLLELLGTQEPAAAE